MYLGACGHWLERAASSNSWTRNYVDVWYEKILEEKKSLSHDSSMLDFFKSSSGAPASPTVLLEIGDDDPDDTPIVKEEVSRPLKKLSLVSFS